MKRLVRVSKTLAGLDVARRDDLVDSETLAAVKHAEFTNHFRVRIALRSIVEGSATGGGGPLLFVVRPGENAIIFLAVSWNLTGDTALNEFT